MEIKVGDVILCSFYFSDMKISKNRPVLVFKDNLPFDDFIKGSIPKDSKILLRKTFVVSKQVIIKYYGSLKKKSFDKFKDNFCNYFECR